MLKYLQANAAIRESLIFRSTLQPYYMIRMWLQANARKKAH